jgi:hypothetical protein
MGREIVYCSQCGVRILEKDLATGRAFTVLDKVFCAECRDQAFAAGGAPASKPAPAAAKPSAAKVAAPPPARLARPEPRLPQEGVQAPHRRVVHAKSKTPMYVACGVGMVLLVVGIIVIMSSGSKPDSKTGGGPGKTGGADPTQGLTPEQKAAHKLNELQLATQGASGDPAGMLKRITEAEKLILGTPSEEGLRSLKKTWQRKLAEFDAGRKIDDVLKQAKSLAAGDPEFKKFDSDVRPLIQKAQEMAMSDATGKVAEVENAKKELEDPYEQKAREWFEDKDDKQGNEARIRVWMREGEHKHALKILETFPPHLKMAKVWQGKGHQLEEECRKGLAKAEGKEVKDWLVPLRLGLEELGRKNYAKAKEQLTQAEAWMPKFENPTEEDKRRVAWALYYNFACLHAEVSKKQEGAEKTKSVDAAFEYLNKSAEAGVLEMRCRCQDTSHQNAKDHWTTDKDLETIRTDPRFEEILKKHGK